MLPLQTVKGSMCAFIALHRAMVRLKKYVIFHSLPPSYVHSLHCFEYDIVWDPYAEVFILCLGSHKYFLQFCAMQICRCFPIVTGIISIGCNYRTGRLRLPCVLVCPSAIKSSSWPTHLFCSVNLHP